MIGYLLRACELGRADARAGNPTRASFSHQQARQVYADAHRRECEAMGRAGRLPQRDLFRSCDPQPCQGEKPVAVGEPG